MKLPPYNQEENGGKTATARNTCSVLEAFKVQKWVFLFSSLRFNFRFFSLLFKLQFLCFVYLFFCVTYCLFHHYYVSSPSLLITFQFHCVLLVLSPIYIIIPFVAFFKCSFKSEHIQISVKKGNNLIACVLNYTIRFQSITFITDLWKHFVVFNSYK